VIFSLGFISFCGLLAFSIIRINQGDYYVAAIELFGAMVILGFLAHVYRTGKTAIAGLVLGVTSVIGVSAVVYLRGTTALHLLFPSMIACFFFMKPNVALTLCLFSIAALSADVAAQIDAIEFYRFLVSIVACLLFSYAFASIRNKQRDELFELSSKDGLTGCGNRRAMDENIQAAIQLHQRNGIAVSLLILDLDDFKQINDQQGHAVGDEILRNVSAAIQSRIRTTDSIYRYGGDEFVVLAPNSNLQRSLGLAENLRIIVEQLGISNNTGIAISLGVAQYLQGQSAVQWLDCADAMLLKAKRDGKNQVLLDL